MVPARPVAPTDHDRGGLAASRHGMLDLDLLEDAYYEVDLAGRMLRFNPAASEILGYPPTELVGKHYREYMPPAFAEQVKELFSEVYQTGRPSRSSEWVMVRPDGTSRRVEGSVSLVRHADGEPVGFCGIIRDVTERRRAEQALRESEERFRALTSLSTDWYWEQDADYRMVRFEGRRSLLRYDPARIVIGHRLWELPRMLLDEAKWDQHRAQLDARETFRDFEYAYLSASGKRYYVSISGAPIFDASGRFTGYRGTSRDVTRAKREQRLLELEHRVTHALSLPAGEHDILATVIETIAQSEGWDTGAYFDFSDETGAARLLVSYCDPDVPAATAEQHRARIGSTIARPALLAQAARTGDTSWIPDVADALTPGSAWRELLMHTGERTLLIVPVQGDGRALGVFTFASRSMREPDGRLQRAMRVVADQVAQFLGRKSAERILRESEARFRALTHLSTDWYWELDTDLRFTRIGSARGDLARSQSGGAALGRHPWRIGLRMASGAWRDVIDAMRRGEPIRDIEIFRRDRRHVLAWYAISGEPTTDDAGRITGYRGIGRDITDRMLAEQRIQRMATHDSLTGLVNRAHFTEKLEEAVERQEKPFALLFIDLDGFKLVNDSLGHEAGDALLREIGARMRGCLRADDIVGRLGGDEFIVLLRDVIESSEVARVAEKIRLLVRQPLHVGGHALAVTPSIGIALHPECADTAAGLMRAADLAMYEAKRGGKDRYTFFCELQPGAEAPPGTDRMNRSWAPV